MDDPDVPNIPPLLLTESQAAKRLGISRSTLRRWRKDGCAPAYLRIGGILRYADSDLQSFITTHLCIAEVA
jgi:excisionase family DNA binding protein